ncbi:MAG: hypothetical protein QM755_17945 [Luteolibacter sp.]
MSDCSLYIHGHGAVTAAGADGTALYQACVKNEELPTIPFEHAVEGGSRVYQQRPVSTEILRAGQPKHPRLRRASNASKFAVIAACQAIGNERMEKIRSRELRIGIVVSFLNGCVNYSNRFFGEVLTDPSLASPILFPETVFNAPASHIAAFLECDGPVYTLIGDSTAWFSAITVAEDWIAAGLVDGCLVLCAEEMDWLTLEGLDLYSRNLVATEGAAAIYVEATPSGISMEKLHGPFPYTDSDERRLAMSEAWSAIQDRAEGILVDGLSSIPRLDRDEVAVTRDWTGARLSPAAVLGEGMGIRCGLQTIAAIEALGSDHESATIFAAGGNQQAFSARLTRHRP